MNAHGFAKFKLSKYFAITNFRDMQLVRHQTHLGLLIIMSSFVATAFGS